VKHRYTFGTLRLFEEVLDKIPTTGEDNQEKTNYLNEVHQFLIEFVDSQVERMVISLQEALMV
jgi:hypothetical protein